MIDYNNPEIQKAILNYASSFDIERNKRWVNVSHEFKNFDQFVVVTIQGLGKLDSKLVIEDQCIIKTGKTSNPFGDFMDHDTLSYLWVLGAYELLRSFDQRAGKDPLFFPNFKKELTKIKHIFTRIRIPLAKFEAATYHLDTDSHIAFPVIVANKGTGWKISNDFWISRQELSDKMLILFEKINT